MEGQSSQTLRELLRLLVRNLGILEKSDVGCCGITITQCHALVEVGRKGSMSLMGLAELLGVDKSTMSRTVNSLVDAGLIARNPDTDDRRYVTIRLTPEGTEAFTTVESGMAAYYHSVFEAIPAEKRAQVLESMVLLTEAVQGCNCC